MPGKAQRRESLAWSADWRFSGGMQFRQSCRTALVLAAVVAALGCRKEEVRVFEAQKDAPAAAPQATAGAGAPAAGESGERPKVPWTVPEGWAEKPSSSGMRLASYGVSAPDGRTVDISVVALGQQAGSELENVNRWRQQLALEPVTLAQLASLQTPVKIGRATASLYDLVSTTPTIDGKHKGRTLAVMWPAGNMTVFFKATGEDALVAENKAKFIAWIGSVQAGGDDAGTPSQASASAPAPAPAPTPAAAPAPAAANAGGDGLPEWQVPAGWKAAGQKPMRLASFDIAGDGGAVADLSISAFPAAAGGLLPNVNRWRGQIGLEAVDEAGLAKESKTVKLAGGSAATVVDLGGGQERILGAIVPAGGRTWFFKLKGPDALVAKERGNFMKFLESVKL